MLKDIPFSRKPWPASESNVCWQCLANNEADKETGGLALPTCGESEDRLHFLQEFDVAVQEICVDLLRLSFPAGKTTSLYPL